MIGLHGTDPVIVAPDQPTPKPRWTWPETPGYEHALYNSSNYTQVLELVERGGIFKDVKMLSEPGHSRTEIVQILDTLPPTYFGLGGYRPVICAKNYAKRDGVGVYISYGGKDATTDPALGDVLGSIKADGVSTAEAAMNYTKNGGRFEMVLVEGNLTLASKVTEAVDVSEDLGDAAEHLLNVISMGGSWGDMLGVPLALFRAIDKLDAPDKPRGAKSRISGYWALRVVDNSANREIPYRSTQDFSCDENQKEAVGKKSFSMPQRDVFVGDLCVVYVDFNSWAQQKSDGYIDSDPAPQCWADIKIEPDAGFAPKYMLYEWPSYDK